MYNRELTRHLSEKRSAETEMAQRQALSKQLAQEAAWTKPESRDTLQQLIFPLFNTPLQVTRLRSVCHSWAEWIPFPQEIIISRARIEAKSSLKVLASLFNRATTIRSRVSPQFVQPLSQWRELLRTLFTTLHSREPLSITELNLPDAAMTIGEIRLLAAALSWNTTLRSLKLPFNPEIAGDEAILLAKSLKANQSLTELDLSGFGAEEGSGFPAVVNILKENTSITHLTLDHNRRESAMVFLGNALIHNQTLAVLSVRGVRFDNDMGATAFGNAVGANTSLRELDLSNTQLGTGSTLEHFCEGFRKNSSLTKIKMGDSEWTKDGMAALGDALAGNTSIARLSISSALLSRSANLVDSAALMSGIGAMKGLRSLKLQMSLNSMDILWSPLSQVLVSSPMIEKISVFHTGCGNDGAIALAHELPGSTSLRRLDLRHISMTALGCLELGKALKANTTLEELDISQNQIGPEGAAWLSEGLQCNTSLRQLWLHNANISKEGCRSIAFALKENRGLREVSFASDDFSDVGACAVGSMLAANATLQSLRFSACLMGDSARELVAGLAKNTSLTELHLSGAHLSEMSISSFAELLKIESCALTSLDLGSNQIRDKSGALLANALQVNTRLQVLFLPGNFLSDHWARTLVENLANNTTLKYVGVGRNKITESGSRTLSKFQQTRPDLHFYGLIDVQPKKKK